MKAITVRQPWASLIVEGHKDVENRSTNWRLRGRVAIHASQLTDWSALEHEHVRQEVGLHAGQRSLSESRFPHGHVVGVAFVVGAHRSEAGCCTSVWADPEVRWHLVLHSAVKLPTPVYASGRLGPWDLPADVEAEVVRQLAEIGMS